MCSEKVVVIIPTYNEALVIEETIAKVFEATASITKMSIHILIFDSNSSDTTQAIVRALMEKYPHLHLLSEPQKTGLGSAYLQAMRYALDELSADYVMEFDADLSHQPHYIPLMLEKLKSHDVVIGSRYIPFGSIPKNWGWHRKLLSVVGNFIARVVLTFQYKDFTSGFRITHKAALEKALPKNFISNHYAYKIQLLWSLHKNKAKISEYPIIFMDREKGKSKLPSNSILDTLKVLFLLRLYDMKAYLNMCLVGLSGMVVQMLVYNVLRQEVPLKSALQCAVACSILNNFMLNYLITFRKRAPLHWIQKLRLFSLFIGYSLLMISAQSYWLQLGIQYLGAGYFNENMILLSGIVLGSFINYFTYTKAIWQRNNRVY